MASTVAALMVVVAVMGAAMGQELPSCAEKLVPCAGYLNATSAPPASCCVPLKEAARDEMPCLCSLFNNTALMKTFNVNITQAIHMAKLCGVTADQSACAATNTPIVGVPPPSSNLPDSSGNKTNSSAASDLAVTKLGLLPGLLTLLLCYCSVVA